LSIKLSPLINLKIVHYLISLFYVPCLLQMTETNFSSVSQLVITNKSSRISNDGNRVILTGSDSLGRTKKCWRNCWNLLSHFSIRKPKELERNWNNEDEKKGKGKDPLCFQLFKQNRFQFWIFSLSLSLSLSFSRAHTQTHTLNTMFHFLKDRLLHSNVNCLLRVVFRFVVFAFTHLLPFDSHFPFVHLSLWHDKPNCDSLTGTYFTIHVSHIRVKTCCQFRYQFAFGV